MQNEILYGVNQRLLGFLLLFCLLLASELGFQLGKRNRAGGETDASLLGVLQGAVLGVLALLLGFTFSMSMTRYERRKNLVIEEANAVGTARLRARTLPAPQAAGSDRLYDRYEKAEALLYAAWSRPEAPPPSNEKDLEALQGELWERGQAAAKGGRDPLTALYVSAVNDVIDLHALRLFAKDDHVPEPVLFLLASVAALAILIVGYGFGVAGRRQGLPLLVACLVVTVVVVLIMDLDRPNRGRITVSPNVMPERAGR